MKTPINEYVCPKCKNPVTFKAWIPGKKYHCGICAEDLIPLQEAKDKK